MKVLPFKIPKKDAILTQVDQGSYFYDILHKHPEYQITHILRGSGTLICDEYLGRFKPGDVVMFGPNQPHVLKCDEEFYQEDSSKTVYAESVFFNYDVLGKGFLNLEETLGLTKFLEIGKNGLKFSSEVSEQAAQVLSDMQPTTEIDLIIHFLGLLKCLMSDNDPEKLSHHPRTMNDIEGERMNAVMQYTLKNFRRHITITEIAEVSNMTPTAFCKYFKVRTRKTYLNYLNELRISYACRQLRTYNPAVSQVAHQSGFQNLSNFNRCFKKIMGITPGKYGRKMHGLN